MNDQSPVSDAFIIDGVSYPALAMPLKLDWITSATRAGFDLIGRARDRYHGVLRCRTCTNDALVRINVIRDATPLCHSCIHDRRSRAAADVGAKLIARDPGHKKHGMFRLPCGHIVRRQYFRVEAAAAGGHALSCEACRIARYDEAARDFDWALIGPTPDARTGYRDYRHQCGHMQSISVGSMRWGDCTCAACGNGWAAKPSFIYLFRINLPGMSVLKLGYSARPAKRLRHQLGLDRSVSSEVIRVLALSSGNLAVREEKACHRHMRDTHPDLVLPKSVFGGAINTQGEIYHLRAEPMLHALIDGVVARSRSAADHPAISTARQAQGARRNTRAD